MRYLMESRCKTLFCSKKEQSKQLNEACHYIGLRESVPKSLFTFTPDEDLSQLFMW